MASQLQKPRPRIRRVREHRAAGHRTILITAAPTRSCSRSRPLFDIYRRRTRGARRALHGFMSAPPLLGGALRG